MARISEINSEFKYGRLGECTMIGTSYGILEIGTALGERFPVEEVVSKYTNNHERIQAWGYEYVHIAPTETSQTDLAVKAAEEALQKAGIIAEELDVIILSISDIPEYMYWDPSAELQRRLGAWNAEVLLVNQACTGGLASFDIMAGKYAIHSEYQNGLIVMANKCCETYRNRVTYNASFRSDGAVAAIVKRDHPHSRWLSTKILTDGTYDKLFRLDWGGAVEPFSKDNIDKISNHSTLAQLRSFFASDPMGLMDFTELVHKRNREVTEKACIDVGITLNDLRRVIYLHDNQDSMRGLARHFGIPIEKTNAFLSTQHGHMGVVDQLFDLKKHLEIDELHTGDYVALVGFGTGMHWIATIIQV